MQEILDAAVAVLHERGYAGATMLAVASRASASKETLYAWFGNKRGLFEAVIRANAGQVDAALTAGLAQAAAPKGALGDFGRALLTLLLSEPAVTINRAAISEAASTPAFGSILAAAGRDSVVPKLTAYLDQQKRLGNLSFTDAQDAAETLIALLIGDLQVRRLLGVFAKPDAHWIESRASRAVAQFLRLYGPY
ncbi:MAG: TetR/AcrR family transcriptional regulator [Hyphomicrobiales bacterium]